MGDSCSGFSYSCGSPCSDGKFLVRMRKPVRAGHREGFAGPGAHDLTRPAGTPGYRNSANHASGQLRAESAIGESRACKCRRQCSASPRSAAAQVFSARHFQTTPLRYSPAPNEWTCLNEKRPHANYARSLGVIDSGKRLLCRKHPKLGQAQGAYRAVTAKSGQIFDRDLD